MKPCPSDRPGIGDQLLVSATLKRESSGIRRDWMAIEVPGGSARATYIGIRRLSNGHMISDETIAGWGSPEFYEPVAEFWAYLVVFDEFRNPQYTLPRFTQRDLRSTSNALANLRTQNNELQERIRKIREILK